MNVDIQQLISVCEPAAAALGFDLVDLELQREPHGWVLRVFIDRLGEPRLSTTGSPLAVDLDDCARVSRELGAVLDASDPIEVAYHLEVSSPGLDRPLRREADFGRFAGRRARLRLREPMDTVAGPRKNFVGTILGADDGRLRLECEGVSFDFPLTFVQKANLDLDDALDAAGFGKSERQPRGRKPPRAHRPAGEGGGVKRASER